MHDGRRRFLTFRRNARIGWTVGLLFILPAVYTSQLSAVAYCVAALVGLLMALVVVASCFDTRARRARRWTELAMILVPALVANRFGIASNPDGYLYFYTLGWALLGVAVLVKTPLLTRKAAAQKPDFGNWKPVSPEDV